MGLAVYILRGLAARFLLVTASGVTGGPDSDAVSAVVAVRLDVLEQLFNIS